MIQFVEIYKTQNDGSQAVIAVCHLADGKVVCEGEAAFIANLENKGISGNPQDCGTPKIFPRDGIKFLEGLRLAFKSGYLSASAVKEK